MDARIKPLVWEQVDDDEWGAVALGLVWGVRQGRASVRVRLPGEKYQEFSGDIPEAKLVCEANYILRVKEVLE